MIDFVYIAKALNSLLPENYIVLPNTYGSSVNIDDRTPILLKGTRSPFSIKEIDSESVAITLETKLNVRNKKERDKQIEELRKITGYKTVNIKDNKGEEYTLAFYIDFNEPTPSFISAGEVYQLYNLSGTLLITNCKTGGLIASQVLTKLTIHDDLEEKEYSAFVPVLACETALILNTENAPCSSNNTFEPKQSGRGRTYALNCVFLNRDFDIKLIKLFNSDNEFEMNQDIKLEKFYKENVIFSTNCRIIDGKIQEQAGQFLSYSLTLQEVADNVVGETA